MVQRSGRLSLLACLTGAFIALPMTAFAQQANDEDTFEQRIIKNILGGMGVDVGRAGIDYRERSPLVIPPTRDLPVPVASDPSVRNPAWPREQQRKLTVSNRPNARASTEEPGSHSVLTPDELRRGTNPRAGSSTTQSPGSLEEYSVGNPVSPRQLGSSSIFNWNALMGTHLNEETKFTGEPTRNALTQPPPGYQTPSPAHPYGGKGESGPGWRIPNILDRPLGNE